MALELTVPAPRAAPPKDLELRPKQAKAWLESLPLAQCLDAGRRVHANLAAMSRSRIEADDRVALLEAYRPVMAVILEELDAIYSKSPLPLTPKARESLTLARDIAVEAAHGYKIAIIEKSAKLMGFGSKKAIPLLSYRAAEYTGASLRASYKAYSPLPAGLWKEMHQLYLHAEKEGFANEVVDAESKTGLLDLYVENLLVSLTDPYRLVPGEVDKVYALIRGVRGVTTLGQQRPDTSAAAHFLVPCDQDRPPKPNPAPGEDTGGPNWRLLDANPVAERLRQRKKAFDTGNVSATSVKMSSAENMALLSKLITLWGDPPKRLSRRDPMDTSVAICSGIKSLSHFVSQEGKIDLMAEQEAIQKGITIPLVHVPMEDISRGLLVNEWEVVNQSAGGLKVRRVGNSSQPIAVGEVIGIKFMGRARWTVGVVRWVTVTDDGGMEFGVQFLAPAAKTVAVTPTINSGGSVKLGLLLVEEGHDAETLLTPPGTFSDLREFEIEEDGLVTCARATSLIERTARFELFQIKPS